MDAGDEEANAIRALFDDLARAVGEGSPAALGELVDRDVLQLAPGAPILEGRPAILHETGHWLSVLQHDLRIRCLEVSCDACWGFCTGTFGLRSICRSEPTTHYIDGKFLAVVRKGEGGRWRLYRVCYNANLPNGA